MPKEVARKFFKGTDVAAKREAQAMLGSIGAGRPKSSFEMVVNEIRETRSQQQNRWYWGYVVKPLADFHSSQEANLVGKRAQNQAHYDLACECLGYDEVTNPRTGEVNKVPWETHTLDIGEFHDYAERCIVWLAQWIGVSVTEHDPVYDPAEPVEASR